MAVTHARENIRVNALCPGPLRTPLLMNYLNTDEKKNRRLVHVPLGRFGEPIEVANAALFLASDESSYITGVDFKIDGGLTAAYVVGLLYLFSEIFYFVVILLFLYFRLLKNLVLVYRQRTFSRSQEIKNNYFFMLYIYYLNGLYFKLFHK